MEKELNKPRLSLARKLLTAVLLTSSVATLITSTVQFIIEYHQDSAALDQLMGNFEKTGLTSIAKFAWNFDQKALDEVVASSLSVNEIQAIIATDSENVELTKIQKPNSSQHKIVQRDFALLSPDGEKFGNLHVDYTRDFIIERIKLQAVNVIATNFLKSIVVSFLLLALFRSMIVSPVVDLAQHFTANQQGQSGSWPALKLRRKTYFIDEFEEVVKGIHEYEATLQENFAKNAALIKRQDEIVQARTSSLVSKSDQLAAAIEAIPGYVFWCDSNLNSLGANLLWLNLQNQADQNRQQSAIFFFTESNHREFKKHVETLQSQPDLGIQYETQVIQQGQTICLLVCLSRLHISDGIMVVAIDKTRNWELEEQAEASRQLALTSARLSALGEMAGGIAHEINNPIAIIHGKMRMLIARLKATPPNLDSALVEANKVIETAERVSKIIRGMAVLSRSGEQDPLSQEPIASTIDAALDVSRGRFKSANIEFRYLRPDASLCTKCRSVQIAQVLINLLNNAADAVREQQNPWIELSVERREQRLIIAVTDSGHGIPEEIRDKVLQPYFTTKPVGSGTGLGLSVAAKIIKDHGGEMYYDPLCPNTRFVIELVLSTATDESGEAA